MSNTSQKKLDDQMLKARQAQLIEQGKAAGKLTTEELVAVLSPIGADMDQIEDTYNALTEAGIEVLSPQDEDETAQEQTTQEQTAQEATEGFEQIGWQRVLELDHQSGYLASVLLRLPEELQIDQWPEDWPEDWNEKWKTGDNWALFFPEEHYEPVDGDLAYLVLTP